MILFLHNRYRTTGGEERVVDDLLWLVREHLGEDAELLDRDSARMGRRHAAAGLLRGGLDPGEVGAAVRRTGARVVHAHNLNPSLGWRALVAARAAGARVVLHLHNYRLVCAVGTCFTRGEDCTRCHGRDTLPGVRLNCRGTGPEAVVYGASLALWQRRLAGQADVVVAPSAFAVGRLRELGAPVGDVAVLPSPVRAFAAGSAAAGGRHALVASRLSPEKGVDTAIDACAAAGVPLVVAGDGPQAAELRERAAGHDVRFLGLVGAERLAAVRAEAALAIVPSRCQENFPLAAIEALSSGVPLVATRMGGIPEIAPADALVPADDPAAMATAIAARYADAEAGRRGLAEARAKVAPEIVAGRLTELYARAEAATTTNVPRAPL